MEYRTTMANLSNFQYLTGKKKKKKAEMHYEADCKTKGLNYGISKFIKQRSKRQKNTSAQIKSK